MTETNDVWPSLTDDETITSVPVKILLVDDDPANIVTLCAILDVPEYELVTARSGKEALRFLLRDSFALVLLDVVMPGMDGFEVATLLRQREATRHVPILFLTALATDITQIYRGYAVGAVDYLQKPLDANTVSAKVRVFVELFRRAEQLRRQSEQLLELKETQYRLREAEMLREQEHRLLQYEQAARQRSEVLSDAGRLLSTSLDSAVFGPDLGRFLVSWLCDWCVIDFLHQGGVPDRSILVHRDPAKEVAAGELSRRWLADPGTRDRLSRGQVVGGEANALAVAAVIGADDTRLVSELGAEAYLCVPLVTDERLLGVLTLVSSRPERSYDQAERLLATELGQRVSLALENARLYREAQTAVSLRDEFVSIASHELKTPVSSVLLRLEMIQRQIAKPERVGHSFEQFGNAINKCVRQVVLLTKLIEKLLDVTKLAEVGVQLSPESVDLGELVVDTIEGTGYQVNATVCPGVVGYWDRMRVEQAVSNLVANAVKYGNNRPIEVSVLADGAHAILTVRDEGIGISPEHHEHIFERFGRATSSRSFGGLGLGLYVTKQIIQAHAGSIQVASEVGVGSTFTVHLPMAPHLTPSRGL